MVPARLVWLEAIKKVWVHLVCLVVPVKKWRRQIRDRYFLNAVLSLKTSGIRKGLALVSYQRKELYYRDNDERLSYHTYAWESREIVKIMLDMGYDVDAVDARAKNFVPKRDYDLVISLRDLIERFTGKWPGNCIKIMHLIESDNTYQRNAEMKRCSDFNRRHGSHQQLFKALTAPGNPIEHADYCSLVGNEHTRSTFPAEHQYKIYLLPVTPSPLSLIKQDNYMPGEKEFLFFSGRGAIHKGLDLVMDVFLKHPEWTLNVVGSFDAEKSFLGEYGDPARLENIRFYGYTRPSSEKFAGICKRCFCYINASCSEATSTAAVTALSVGLYPVISRDTGLDLPENAGKYLSSCSLEEIEQTVSEVWEMDGDEVVRQTACVQKMVLEKFTRKNFSNGMRLLLSRFLNMEQECNPCASNEAVKK